MRSSKCVLAGLSAMLLVTSCDIVRVPSNDAMPSAPNRAARYGILSNPIVCLPTCTAYHLSHIVSGEFNWFSDSFDTSANVGDFGTFQFQLGAASTIVGNNTSFSVDNASVVTVQGVVTDNLLGTGTFVLTYNLLTNAYTLTIDTPNLTFSRTTTGGSATVDPAVCPPPIGT